MTLENWTLGTLMAQIREEFSVKNTGDENSRIRNKINQALTWLVGMRPNWPWLRKELTVDVSDSVTGTVSATRGSKVVTVAPESVVDLSGIVPRDIFVPGSQASDATEGYLVESFSTPQINIISQYRGTTSSSLVARIQKGWFQLPEDFIRLETISRLDRLDAACMVKKSPKIFDEIKKQRLGVGLRDTIYTTTKDPLGTDERIYLGVYPFISSLTTMQGTYWADPAALVNDSDVPPAPRNDRTVLFHFACWFYAQSKGAPSVQFHKEQAMIRLDKMTNEYEFDDNDDAPDPVNDPAAWIQGPENYPEFH